jgi:ribosomal protein S18 acetylase RimI-like enzyme
MPIEYRETKDVDLLQLARLFESAGWTHRIRDFGRLAQLVRGSLYLVSAWDGERLVGFTRAISDGAFNAYVSTTAVLPEYQQRGIGRELVRLLLQGRDGILFVLHADPSVHPFWEKVGFEKASDMLRRSRRH